MLTRRHFIADRLKGVRFSATLRYLERVSEMKRKGLDVIDFDSVKPKTPRNAKEATKKMLQSPFASDYPHTRGLPELREAIRDKLKRENNLKVDPESEILVTVGAKQGLFTSMLSTINPGDEVLIEDPVWVSYDPLIRICGGIPVPVTLRENEKFALSPDEIKRRITSRTKMIILCNPHCPTGAVRSRKDCKVILDIAEEYDLLILVDESYERLVYEGEHCSVASLPGSFDRTITVQASSKIYNMYGWRVGWTIASENIIDQMLSIHSNSITGPTSFAQAGVVVALRDNLALGNIPIPELLARFKKQRDTLLDELTHISGVSCVVPQGGYFCFPNFSTFKISSMRLCEYLLEKGHVAVTPGVVFGQNGEDHLRLDYQCPANLIRLGMRRVTVALDKLRSTRE